MRVQRIEVENKPYPFIKFYEEKEYVIVSVPKRAGVLLKTSVQIITENHL